MAGNRKSVESPQRAEEEAGGNEGRGGSRQRRVQGVAGGNRRHVRTPEGTPGTGEEGYGGIWTPGVAGEIRRPTAGNYRDGTRLERAGGGVEGHRGGRTEIRRAERGGRERLKGSGRRCEDSRGGAGDGVRGVVRRRDCVLEIRRGRGERVRQVHVAGRRDDGQNRFRSYELARLCAGNGRENGLFRDAGRRRPELHGAGGVRRADFYESSAVRAESGGGGVYGVGVGVGYDNGFAVGAGARFRLRHDAG